MKDYVHPISEQQTSGDVVLVGCGGGILTRTLMGESYDVPEMIVLVGGENAGGATSRRTWRSPAIRLAVYVRYSIG
jgi:hypothetical protein